MDANGTKGEKQSQQVSKPALHNRQTITHKGSPDKEKLNEGQCYLCGAEGTIVERISHDSGQKEHRYYSFRVKKKERRHTTNGLDRWRILKGTPI